MLLGRASLLLFYPFFIHKAFEGASLDEILEISFELGAVLSGVSNILMVLTKLLGFCLTYWLLIGGVGRKKYPLF